MLLLVEFPSPVISGLPPYCVLLSSRHSSLGNVILLFSWSVLVVLRFQTYLWSKIQNPCYAPFLVIISFMPHNHLIIFVFHRYIHIQEYLYKCIMYDRISSYINEVHPSSWTLVSSVFSGLLWNTSVISVTLKFGTMRLWGGATYKLKPSPFHPTPVLQKLHVVFCHLTDNVVVIGHNTQVKAKSLSSNSGPLDTLCSVPSLNTKVYSDFQNGCNNRLNQVTVMMSMVARQ